MTPHTPFGNKNKQNAEELPPTLSNCFIVNIVSEKSKRKRHSNSLLNTCKMQMKGWQEHIYKRHFILKSPLSMGHIFWFINEPCSNSQTPSLSVHRQHGLLCSHTEWYCFQSQHRYRNSTALSTTPVGYKLAPCKDSLGISLKWCGKCKLKL